ncbi:MAG: YbaN family protein [Xanthomonadales bacterium]|nr:YbaN family protein [Xanthomonadales bacterium]
MKYLLLSLGWLFFAVGVIGIFLPVLPTTPFMILALWCFSKSSERFHYWLYHHKIFGPGLKLWDQHRVIPLIAKIFALSFIAISLAYLFVFSSLVLWVKLLAATSMLAGAIYVLSKPSKPPTEN